MPEPIIGIGIIFTKVLHWHIFVPEPLVRKAVNRFQIKRKKSPTLHQAPSFLSSLMCSPIYLFNLIIVSHALFRHEAIIFEFDKQWHLLIPLYPLMHIIGNYTVMKTQRERDRVIIVISMITMWEFFFSERPQVQVMEMDGTNEIIFPSFPLSTLQCYSSECVAANAL